MLSQALDRVHRQWTVLGQKVPLWAILTRPGSSGKTWDTAAFFTTGVQEISEVVRRVESAAPLRFGVAVDFGCGVGRLTQALAERFESVVGVDISGPMIREAARFNRFGNRCRFIQNVSADIGILPNESADLVYSSITLQHVIPELAKSYIREFFRIARPGAHIIFQLPAQPRSALKHWIKGLIPIAVANALWRLRASSPAAIETYFIPEQEVRRLILDAGGRVAFVDQNQDGPAGWRSLKYFCLR